MARTNREFPIPKLYTINGRFVMRWYADKKPYQVSLGKANKSQAQAICTAAGAAFANRADFPDEIRDEPALKRYLLTRDNISSTNSDEALIKQYFEHMTANTGQIWAKTARCYLKTALQFTGDLYQANTFSLQSFLDHIASTRSNSTRNRYRAALSGFYRWLRVTGQHPKHFNPLGDIKKAKEQRGADGIVIWEDSEIKPLFEAADQMKDGIAIWIGVLAGLRRSEIARLAWPDVSEAYIKVSISKTGKGRTVPLSKMLAERLEREKAKTGRTEGRIVPWPEKLTGWTASSGRMIQTYLPRRLPEMHEAHPEKFGWNALRHTFASRHAQKGLSLNVIAAWMGNSPDVCKLHYARFVPKNSRDERIDNADPVL